MFFVKSAPKLGPLGPATVSISGKIVQIVYEGTGEVVTLPVTTLPEGTGKLPAGKYSVGVSADRTRLNHLVPLNASVEVRFIGLKHRDGQPPFPQQPFNKTGEKRGGGTYPKDWLEWQALHRVEPDDLYAGLIIPYKMRYYFTVGADGITAIAGEGKHSQAIGRYFDVCTNGQKITIPFSENVLPALEAFLLEHGVVFQLHIENGFVNTVSATIQKPVKRKSAAKKTAAKKTSKKK
jgi:hypothetical protein